MTLREATTKRKTWFRRYLEVRLIRRRRDGDVNEGALFRLIPRRVKAIWAASRRLFFYRVQSPLGLPRLSEEQRWICRHLECSESAYRVRSFEGVQMTDWNPILDGRGQVLDLERYVTELREKFREDLKVMGAKGFRS